MLETEQEGGRLVTPLRLPAGGDLSEVDTGDIHGRHELEDLSRKVFFFVNYPCNMKVYCVSIGVELK